MQKIKDLTPVPQFGINGTDLGIPYVLENGSIGYLFGDTFNGPFPGSPGWRSPVGLRSTSNLSDGIKFSSAYKPNWQGHAGEIMPNAHDGSGNTEVSVIPNDGISFPETGRQIISYMSVKHWPNGTWETNHMGLAFSDDGNNFTKLPWHWANNSTKTDVLQMTSMQRDGNYVYLVSTSNGRHLTDGLYMRRVPWDKMFDPSAYEHWTWYGGSWQWTKNYHWHWHPILPGRFGEPSMRKLQDGRWVISVIDAGNDCAVLFDGEGPDKPWRRRVIKSNTSAGSLYGFFVHPHSSMCNLHLIVSEWTSKRYGVSQYKLDATAL